MAARALIFDLDGTIWNSHPLYARLIELSGGPAVAHTERALRNGWNAARLLRASGLDGVHYQAAIDLYSPGLQLYQSAQNCLASLNLRGMPLGVVTSLPSWIWHPMIKAAHIDGFIGPIEGWKRGYSKASAIRLVLRTLGVTPGKDVWYVGDLDSDREAAHAAGISYAWASWGYSSATPVAANEYLYSFTEVLDL